MTLYARLAALLVVLLAITAGCWKVIHDADRRGYLRAQAEAKDAADELTARNRDLMRAAEMRYTVAAQTRGEFFTKAEKEIRNAAAPLAACPVPADLRMQLNEAAACARDPAACGAAVQVPDAR